MLAKIIISAIGMPQMVKINANQAIWRMMTARIRKISQVSLNGSRTRFFMKCFIPI